MAAAMKTDDGRVRLDLAEEEAKELLRALEGYVHAANVLIRASVDLSGGVVMSDCPTMKVLRGALAPDTTNQEEA